MNSAESTCFEHQREAVRAHALQLGFTACGFARAEPVGREAQERYDNWISSGHNDCMDYTERYREVRNDPRLLLEGAKTVICVAMNYYPRVKQDPEAPQFAYYAYGSDYHDVVKRQLFALAAFIKQLTGAESRACVDTAPIREKYWAQQAGIGFVGRNNLLIIPNKGSYFFLGELVTTLDVTPDPPCTLDCGNCRLCEKLCPGGALSDGRALDASRCLSCQLIERRGDLPDWVSERIGNHIYGCDECQKCCPHNRFATATDIADFDIREPIRHITPDRISQMSDEEFRAIFRGSAVKRIKLPTLKRNLQSIRKNSK